MASHVGDGGFGYFIDSFKETAVAFITKAFVLLSTSLTSAYFYSFSAFFEFIFSSS